MFSEKSHLILSREDNPSLMHLRQVYKSHHFLEVIMLSINIEALQILHLSLIYPKLSQSVFSYFRYKAKISIS